MKACSVVWKLLSSLAIVSLLAGCSSLPDWLGGSTDVAPVEGERIAVMEVDTVLRPDTELAKTVMTLPYPQRNVIWAKGRGAHAVTPSHLRLPVTFDKDESVDIGSGSDNGLRLSSGPVIGDGKVFTLDAFGSVRAHDLDNIKNRIWENKIKVSRNKGTFISAGMVLHYGKLVLTTGDNQVVALNPENGEVIWRRTINSISRAAPAASGRRVYVNTIDNRLYALNVEDGAILWTHSGVFEDIARLGAAAPLAVYDLVLVTYSSGEIFALQAKTGRELWSDSLGSSRNTNAFALVDVDASPVVAGNTVLAISSEGVLAALELSTGQRIWELDVSGNQTPWVAGDYIFLITSEAKLVAVHVNTGKIRWIKQVQRYEDEKDKEGEISWSGPILASGRLWLVGSHGRVFSINPASGALEDIIKVRDEIYLPPIVADDKMFLLSNDAKLIGMFGDVNKNPSAEDVQ